MTGTLSRRLWAILLVVGAPLVWTAPAWATTTALWHMDELTGTTMTDSSGGGNDGTIVNGGGTNPILGAAGYRGTSYSFDGTSVGGYVDIPSSAGLNPKGADLRLTAHVNFTVLPSVDYDLMRKGLSTTRGGDYKMEILSSGYAHCYFKGSKGRGFGITKARVINNGAWHTIQCVKTATTVQVIVDGRAKTRTVTVGTISNTSHLFVGAKPGDDYYHGLLDEMQVDIG
jgi:hypothetical protein